MKITPLDIQQQQFKGKLFGGLHPDDVDSFLQAVSREMENLIRENTSLREQVQHSQSEAAALAQREKELREMLLAAQKITEEMKNNARKEAELLLAEAEVQAEKILAEAQNRVVQLKNDIQELRRQKTQFETSFRALLDSHYKMFAVADE
ncbi:MAG: DivIVA domain-containing protein [Geobacteraceae bacterium]|nr:DivIVA domain-containing protein [Geobacteraceae bacterium]